MSTGLGGGEIDRVTVSLVASFMHGVFGGVPDSASGRCLAQQFLRDAFRDAYAMERGFRSRSPSPPSSGEDAIVDLEVVLIRVRKLWRGQGREMVGGRLTISAAKGWLRQQGAGKVAGMLSKHSKARNCQAHALATQILSELEQLEAAEQPLAPEAVEVELPR